MQLRELKEFKLTKEEALEQYEVWTVEPCTGKQRAFIYGLLEQTNTDLEDFYVDDLHDLTKLEASYLIDELKEKRDSIWNGDKRGLW
jgi:hypothetical protein